jgi:hypothetical protein
MKATPQVNKFGKFIVTKMRDKAIDFFEGLAAQHWKSPSTLRLQADLAKLTKKQQSIIRRCLIASIDEGLHSFLFALGEAHDFNQVIGVTVDGVNVAEPDQTDGLHGEMFGEKGWIAQFSKYPDLEE